MARGRRVTAEEQGGQWAARKWKVGEKEVGIRVWLESKGCLGLHES